MEIEGFKEIISMITMAKELYDMGRYDVVEKQFFDVLSYDGYYENMLGLIEAVFSGFDSNYDESNETNIMLFSDELISKYFIMAWEYGQAYKIPHDRNPYVRAAEEEVRKLLGFSYNLDWRLLGYTKTRATARKSKLVVYTSACEFCEEDHLAYGLLMLYKWFADKCAECMNRKEAIAA